MKEAPGHGFSHYFPIHQDVGLQGRAYRYGAVKEYPAHFLGRGSERRLHVCELDARRASGQREREHATEKDAEGFHRAESSLLWLNRQHNWLCEPDKTLLDRREEPHKPRVTNHEIGFIDI